MPYICVNTTKTLTNDQKTQIKAGLGKHVSIIPEKSEEVLMVDIVDGKEMYLGGKLMDNCAYIDIRNHHTSDLELRKKFTEKVFEVMRDATGFKNEEMYLTISQFDYWGALGTQL